MQSFQASGN